MKYDRLWMNLFWLVRILVSLALDEHAKQYVLALFPGWSPRLQQFLMYSLRSFLVVHTSFVCSQSISTLTNLIEKSMNIHNVKSTDLKEI